MILALMTGAALAGLNSVQIKLCGYAVLEGTFFHPSSLLLFLVTSVQAFCLLGILNLTMAHYP